MSKRKQYLPPDKDAVEEYARRVCEAAEVNNNEIIYGFAGFLKAATRAFTNNLNRQGETSHE